MSVHLIFWAEYLARKSPGFGAPKFPVQNNKNFANSNDAVMSPLASQDGYHHRNLHRRDAVHCRTTPLSCWVKHQDFLCCDVVCLLEPLEPEIISGHLKVTRKWLREVNPKVPKSGSKVTKVTQKSDSKVAPKSLWSHLWVTLGSTSRTQFWVTFRCPEMTSGSRGSSRKTTSQFLC